MHHIPGIWQLEQHQYGEELHQFYAPINWLSNIIGCSEGGQLPNLSTMLEVAARCGYDVVLTSPKDYTNPVPAGTVPFRKIPQLGVRKNNTLTMTNDIIPIILDPDGGYDKEVPLFPHPVELDWRPA